MKTLLRNKRHLTGYWYILYTNSMDMYKEATPTTIGRAYEVQTSVGKYHDAFYDYIQTTKNGFFNYQRLYKNKCNYRLRNKKYMEEHFPDYNLKGTDMNINIPVKVIEKTFDKKLNGAIINKDKSTLFFDKEPMMVIDTAKYFAEYLI